MLGNFPDEKAVYDLSTRGEWGQLNNILTYHVYVYLLLWVCLSIAGVFVQYTFFSYDDNEKSSTENQKGNASETEKLT